MIAGHEGVAGANFRERHHDQGPRRRPGGERSIRDRLRRQGETANAAGPPLCHPHLHGRAADPAKFAGLQEGDAHVIRNAGGRASDDAIRSLVISHKLLGTNAWFVVHHTDCGMETFTNDVMRGLLRQSLDPAEVGPDGWKDVGQGPGSTAGDTIDWLTIKDQAESVTSDVARIRSHPLVPADMPIYGYIYDVQSGRLIEVTAATAAGKV